MPNPPTLTEGGPPEDRLPNASSADVGNQHLTPGSTKACHGDTDPPTTFPFLAPRQQPNELGRL